MWMTLYICTCVSCLFIFRCRHWLKSIGRTDLESKCVNTLHKYYYVCDLHFTESECSKRYLRRDTVPTLMLPQLQDWSGISKYTQTDVNLSGTSNHTQTDINLPSTSKYTQTGVNLSCKSIQTSENLSCTSKCTQTDDHVNLLCCSQSSQTTNILSVDTPRKRKLRLELNSERKKRRVLESITENRTDDKESDIAPLLQKIINAQKVLQRNYKGNRYHQEYIMLALNIYYASPIAYRFLSGILHLPTIRTLQRRVAFGISTKFDENVIKCLQSKIRNLSESEKYCIICADEVSLKRHLHYQIDKDKVVGFHEINEIQTKEIATQAFVVMARGIFAKWKQPLAFCFLGHSKNYAELNTWLENIIAKMIDIGFNVCAFTSDQGSNFINMAKNKSVCPDQPFFFVNDRKIYYIFDVPHLIKSLRNNLLKYNFVYHDDGGSEKVASWNDIEKIYDMEKNANYKMAYKLTESHIRPNNFEKMRVKYATQVLSRTVAVTISTLVESGKLHEKSMGTARFLELINDTFDILNSSTVSNDYIYKKTFYHAEYQTNDLQKVQRIFSGLRVINRNNGKDVTNTMKFIKGFLISVKAISSLASDLKIAGYKYLFTRRLNQDALENFFGKVRQQSGDCREPTAIQFLTTFKKLFMVNIIRHSDYANCADDLDQLLMSVEETQMSLRSEENALTDSLQRPLQVWTNDYRFEIPEVNAFTYVCGYLLKKCLDHHKDCEVMKNYSNTCRQVDENSFFTYYKAYKMNHEFGALINPPDDFVQYIMQIDKICEDYFNNYNFNHIGNEIMIKISETAFNLPCRCFPLEYLKKLFVRFRIFNLMRHNNKNFRDKSFKRKYFSVSHL